MAVVFSQFKAGEKNDRHVARRKDFFFAPVRNITNNSMHFSWTFWLENTKNAGMERCTSRTEGEIRPLSLPSTGVCRRVFQRETWPSTGMRGSGLLFSALNWPTKNTHCGNWGCVPFSKLYFFVNGHSTDEQVASALLPEPMCQGDVYISELETATTPARGRECAVECRKKCRVYVASSNGNLFAAGHG